MMTPREKAKDLFDKFESAVGNNVSASGEFSSVDFIDEAAKQCALVAADEVISVSTEMPVTISAKFFIQFWNQVKKEIEKL
jgi:hypothetical protein